MEDLMVISGIGFTVILLWVLAHVGYELHLDKKHKEDQEDGLLKMFDCCWSGKHEDIPYAWFRVIQHLKQWNHDPDLIRMAEIKREQALRIKSDAWMVNEQGELINENGNSNDLEEV